MNTYDFDKTIFYPDSSACFYKHCLKNHTAAVLKTLPRTAIKAIKYALGKIKTKELKEQLFSFLPDVMDIDQVVESFWQDNYGGIGKWYLEQKKDDDIIISASPEFLLKPICQKLGINHLIASRVDPKSGKFLGENCRGEEKVKRLAAEYSVIHIDKFYSDSKSDLPLAQIADQSFLVQNGTLSEWDIQK